MQNTIIVTLFLCALFCASSYCAPTSQRRLERRQQQNVREQQQLAASRIKELLANTASQGEMVRTEGLKSLILSNPELVEIVKKILSVLIEYIMKGEGGELMTQGEQDKEQILSTILSMILEHLPTIISYLLSLG